MQTSLYSRYTGGGGGGEILCSLAIAVTLKGKASHIPCLTFRVLWVGSDIKTTLAEILRAELSRSCLERETAKQFLKCKYLFEHTSLSYARGRGGGRGRALLATPLIKLLAEL